MPFDPVAEIEKVDGLIDRVARALDDAQRHGNQILIDLDERKLDELILLRELLVKQRGPVE